jgi:hypothetical protein
MRPKYLREIAHHITYCFSKINGFDNFDQAKDAGLTFENALQWFVKLTPDQRLQVVWPEIFPGK